MPKYEGPLLFCDIEATGLDPREYGASILEVGLILTTGPELTEVATANLLIRPAGSTMDLDRLWTSMPTEVQEMHTANGLWAEVNNPDSGAWLAHEGDSALANWLTNKGVTEPIPLAGSGVGHYDLQWIKVHMPALAARLAYWTIDIGVMRRLLQYAGRDDLVDLPTDVDAKPHRALPDARLHVAEGRRHLAALSELGGAP